MHWLCPEVIEGWSADVNWASLSKKKVMFWIKQHLTYTYVYLKFWSIVNIFANIFKWPKDDKTPAIETEGGWLCKPHFKFSFLDIFLLRVGVVFISAKGFKRVVGKSQFSPQDADYPIAINCNMLSVFLSQKKCWAKKCTGSPIKDRALATTWFAQSIFGKKSWKDEWKKTI